MDESARTMIISGLSNEKSAALFQRANRVEPGGVQGQGRSASPFPLFMSRADGSHIWDVDGNEFIDFHAGFGSVILGHNASAVRDGVLSAFEEHGVTFATANPLEVELAEQIAELVPCAERSVFPCTGTEATYHAIRLARGATGRERIVKLEGHYHGWHDYVSWSVRFEPDAMSNPDSDPVPIPASTGMLRAVEDSVVIRQYNDVDGVRDAIERYGTQIAALILEPIFLNAGVILPEPGFLEACRELCTKAGIVLIFDEVITGFRVALGGAQELTGVTPDLTTLGKAVANGFPVSVLTGRADLMDRLVPRGDVLFGGTFAGHVANTAAAIACTGELRNADVYRKLEALGQQFESAVSVGIAETEVRAQFCRVGSVWTLYFTDRLVRNYRDVASLIATKNNEVQAIYRRWMLERGVYIHPHYMLRGYITAAHTEEDIDRAASATVDFLREHRQRLQ